MSVLEQRALRVICDLWEEHKVRGPSVAGAQRLVVELADKRSEFAQALKERNAARASAIEWANTPIHRLLAAYGRRTQDTVIPQLGHLRKLTIEHDEVMGWMVTWERWLLAGVAPDAKRQWMATRCSAETIDAACTNAAEAIEAYS